MKYKQKQYLQRGVRSYTLSYMVNKENFAYIDGANLHKGTQSLGLELDYKKFRKWLFWKYHITKAYIFIGYITSFENLYSHLKIAGFDLVFKESVLQAREIKANVDAEIDNLVFDLYELTTEERTIVLDSTQKSS